MQRIFATQYVVAGESYGFPGDPLVCDDDARTATLRPGGLLPYQFADHFIPRFIPLMVIALCYPEVPRNRVRLVEVVAVVGVQEEVKHD